MLQRGLGVVWLGINSVTEHQPQSGSRCDHDEVTQKQDPFVVLSKHRQKQGHCKPQAARHSSVP